MSASEKCCMTLLFCVLCGLASAQEIGPEKKIVEWGADQPDTAYLREHITEMEQQPFDGVIFGIRARTPDGDLYLSHQNWGIRRFTEAELRTAIDNLSAVRFHRFTDNFIRLSVTPGDVDYFDPGFEAVLENARLAARVAARARGFVKGFMFDTEMYEGPVFTYSAQKYASSRSYEEYSKKAFERGGQFLSAIQSELPSVTILITHGCSELAGQSREKIRDGGNGLLIPFVDGMLAAAKGDTSIVDAFEGSYLFRDDAQFVRARNSILQDTRALSSVPEAYATRMRVGFGLFMDQAWRQVGWFSDNPDKNQLSPLEFEYALHRALTRSDRYVWVYSERPNWWTGERLNPAYVEAVRNARKPHDAAWKTARALPACNPGLSPAASIGGDDAAVFAPLWTDHDLIMDLPRDWKFHTDPKDAGDKEHWYARDVKEADWSPIQIGKFWDEQGHPNYLGAAWYRTTFTVPASARGRTLILSVGAADETAKVYVNGHFAGQYGFLGYTWHDRFEIDVTKFIHAGTPNTVAIRVENSMGQGGLWKSIKLISPKTEAP